MLSIKYGIWEPHPSVEGGYESTWYYLHDPSSGDPTTIAPGGQLTRSVDDIDALTFQLYTTNDAFGQLVPIKTHVKAIDEDTDEMLFYGRVIGVEPTMDADGQIYELVTCEQAEAFLLDSTIDTTKFINPHDLDSDGFVMMQAVDFLTEVFNQHNDQVVLYERMDLGDLGFLTDQAVMAKVPWTYGTVAHDLIQDVIIDDFSNTDPDTVWFWSNYNRRLTFDVTEDSGGSYLIDITLNLVDYENTETVGTIELGVNMGAVSREPDYTDIVTVVYPWGDEYHETIDKGKKTEWKRPYRLKLADYLNVYGNPESEWLDYFTFDTENNLISYDPGVAEYGSIGRPLQQAGLSQNAVDKKGKKTEEVVITREQASRFLWGAMQYLIKHSQPQVSVTVTAYDLSLIGYDIASFSLYQRWNIDHSLLGLQENLPVIRYNIDLDNPHLSSLEFGTKGARESDQQNEQSTALAQVAQSTGNGKSIEVTHLGQSNRVGSDVVNEVVGGGADLTQYLPMFYSTGNSEYWYPNSGEVGNYINGAWDAELTAYKCFTDGVETDLPLPARTIAKVMLTVFYIGIIWQLAYHDTKIGNLLGYVLGDMVNESDNGLLGTPLSWGQAYDAIKAKDDNGTLQWSDVEKYVQIGAMAYSKGVRWPWVCNMPFFVTGARVGYSPEVSSHPYMLDTQTGMSFQRFKTKVTHPTDGSVTVAWVLVSAITDVLNASSAAVDVGDSSLSIAYNTIMRDNAPPDGANPTAAAELGIMGTLHSKNYGSTITRSQAHSLQVWGHSMFFTEGQNMFPIAESLSGNRYVYGRSIDDHSRVALPGTVVEFRERYPYNWN